MAQNVNSVVIVGNLTKDVELRHTPSGTAVTTLRVAVNDRVKRGEDWGDVAYYFDVVVWARDAENCAQYLSKGKPVAVQGKLTWREWDATDGTKRQSVEIKADRVQFLGSGSGGGGGGQSGGESSGSSSSAGGEFVPSQGSAADDDIPF